MVYIKPDVGNFSRGLVSRVGPVIGNAITSEVNALFRPSSQWNGKSLVDWDFVMAISGSPGYQFFKNNCCI